MFSSTHPEQDTREVRVVDQQRVFYPNAQEDMWSASAGNRPIGYERTVRREYKKSFIDLKFLIPALILGLVLASGGFGRDHYGASITDRLGDTFHSIGDRVSDSFSWFGSLFVPRRAPLHERMLNKARYGAYDAKNKVMGGIDTLSSSAAVARDKLSDGVSYLGDKIMDTATDAQDAVLDTLSNSRSTLRRAGDRAYELGRDAKDKAWDTKEHLMDRVHDMYDDAEYEYVRRPVRRVRRSLPTHSRWSISSFFSAIPWMPLLLGALVFFGLRPLINEWRSRSLHMGPSTQHTSSTDMYTSSRGMWYNRILSGLALLLNKLGDFLFRTGSDIREADSFRNLKPAPTHMRHSSDMHSSDMDISRSTESDLHRRSDVSYAPIISSHSTSVPSSHISTTSSLPSSTVPSSKLSSGVSSDISEPRVTSSGVAWTVPPANVEPVKTIHSVSVKPADPVLLDKIAPEANKKDIDTFHKSEGEPRVLFGGK